MRKIIPDPPHLILSLKYTLIKAMDYAICAATVAHQALQLQPKPPACTTPITAVVHGASWWAPGFQGVQFVNPYKAITPLMCASQYLCAVQRPDGSCKGDGRSFARCHGCPAG